MGLAVDAFVEQMRNVNNTEAAISGLPRTMLALCKFRALQAVKRKVKEEVEIGP